MNDDATNIAAVGAAGDSAQENVASTREELNVILDRIAAQGAGDSALRAALRELIESDDALLEGGGDINAKYKRNRLAWSAARAALSVEERAGPPRIMLDYVAAVRADGGSFNGVDAISVYEEMETLVDAWRLR